jgi:hypothetical protein
MVGHQTLNLAIGVRVPASQPSHPPTTRDCQQSSSHENKKIFAADASDGFQTLSGSAPLERSTTYHPIFIDTTYLY